MRIEDTFYRRQNASAAERGLRKRQLYNCYVTMYASQIRERRKDRQRGGRTASKYARYCYCTQRDTGELREERWGHFLKSDLEYE